MSICNMYLNNKKYESIMLTYLLTYIFGFFSSILYHDYISIPSEINLHLDKIKNENKVMSVQLQLIKNNLDKLITRESSYSRRRASP